MSGPSVVVTSGAEIRKARNVNIIEQETFKPNLSRSVSANLYLPSAVVISGAENGKLRRTT